MNKRSILKSTVSASILLACSGAIQLAQADVLLAANGNATAGLDVTMTVMPDSHSLPEAVDGVISLPATAAAQAKEQAQGAAGAAGAATAGVGTGQASSADLHGAAQGTLDVGGSLGEVGGVVGADAGAAADLNTGGDLGADISNDSADLGEQLGGSVGGDLATGLKLH